VKINEEREYEIEKMLNIKSKPKHLVRWKKYIVKTRGKIWKI